jgi:hypothetical protein
LSSSWSLGREKRKKLTGQYEMSLLEAFHGGRVFLAFLAMCTYALQLLEVYLTLHYCSHLVRGRLQRQSLTRLFQPDRVRVGIPIPRARTPLSADCWAHVTGFLPTAQDMARLQCVNRTLHRVRAKYALLPPDPKAEVFVSQLLAHCGSLDSNVRRASHVGFEFSCGFEHSVRVVASVDFCQLPPVPRKKFDAKVARSLRQRLRLVPARFESRPPYELPKDSVAQLQVLTILASRHIVWRPSVLGILVESLAVSDHLVPLLHEARTRTWTEWLLIVLLPVASVLVVVSRLPFSLLRFRQKGIVNVMLGDLVPEVARLQTAQAEPTWTKAVLTSLPELTAAMVLVWQLLLL